MPLFCVCSGNAAARQDGYVILVHETEAIYGQ